MSHSLCVAESGLELWSSNADPRAGCHGCLLDNSRPYVPIRGIQSKGETHIQISELGQTEKVFYGVQSAGEQKRKAINFLLATFSAVRTSCLLLCAMFLAIWLLLMLA